MDRSIVVDGMHGQRLDSRTTFPNSDASEFPQGLDCFTNTGGSSPLFSLPNLGVHAIELASSSRGLSEWQSLMLEMWYANNPRRLTETEVVLFSGLFKAPGTCVKSLIQQLFAAEGTLLMCDAENKADGVPTSAQLNSGLTFGATRQLPTDHLGTSVFRVGIPGETLNTWIEGHSIMSLQSNPGNATYTSPIAGLYKVDDCGDSGGMLGNTTKPPTVEETFGGQDSADTRELWSAWSPATMGGANESCLSLPSDVQNGSAPRHVAMTEIDQSGTGLLNFEQARLTTALLPGPWRMTPSLNAAIMKSIQSRGAKGCQRIRIHEKQSGIYECTLKCRRLFKNACDLFRHEATVFPQEFWFCTRCGDLDQASGRYLFTREDKMRQHNRVVHTLHGHLTNCKVPKVPRVFPKQCPLCTHHRYRSWRDRCEHIAWHYQRGDTIPKLFQDPDPDAIESPSTQGDTAVGSSRSGSVHNLAAANDCNVSHAHNASTENCSSNMHTTSPGSPEDHSEDGSLLDAFGDVSPSAPLQAKPDTDADATQSPINLFDWTFSTL